MSVFVEPAAEAIQWLDHATCPARGKSTRTLDQPRFFPASAVATPSARRAALLHRVVASEILPRLALARQGDGFAPELRPTTEVDTAALVDLLLNQEAPAVLAFVEQRQCDGATPEALYLGLLSSAARALGVLWEQDRCTFVDVTIGLGRLQQVARVLAPRFQLAAVHRAKADGVLLLPARGEQHTFGLLLLAEFFQRAGWCVTGGPVPVTTDPAETVRGTWFDVAGFSIGSERGVEGLTRDIRRVRRASRNRDLGILVGGPLLLRQPELVARIGADATATDAPNAVLQARRLLSMRVAADG